MQLLGKLLNNSFKFTGYNGQVHLEAHAMPLNGTSMPSNTHSSSLELPLAVDGRSFCLRFDVIDDGMTSIYLSLPQDLYQVRIAMTFLKTACFRRTFAGIGIAPDKLLTIFAPFSTLDKSLTRPTDGGLGLGLGIFAHEKRCLDWIITLLFFLYLHCCFSCIIKPCFVQ